MLNRFILGLRYRYFKFRWVNDGFWRSSYALAWKLIHLVRPSTVEQYFNKNKGETIILGLHSDKMIILISQFNYANILIARQADIPGDLLPDRKQYVLNEWLVDVDNRLISLTEAIETLVELIHDHDDILERVCGDESADRDYYLRMCGPIYEDLIVLFRATIEQIVPGV